MRRRGEGTTVEEPDGTTTEYDEVAVEGERVERLLRELFGDHWEKITFGPLIEGAAWEIQLTAPPKLTMLDGYLTVDTGAWHFHLCVADHRSAPSETLARIRRVARAAFFRSHGGSCSPTTWGLRLWNGRGEQMITILFPNPYFDDAWKRLAEPAWRKTELWEDFRRRYAGGE
ncbi:MAG: hypothetical protein HY727_02405 [Candidatus Rokubacteria bacterium]|nr:hypothetical protein [Candidatus Rokubacteria bacterium]